MRRSERYIDIFCFVKDVDVFGQEESDSRFISHFIYWKDYEKGVAASTREFVFAQKYADAGCAGRSRVC